MSDQFKAFLAQREAQQRAQSSGSRWLMILGAIAVVVVIAFVVLRGDPSKRILDPNKATAEELATLPEVGPVMAEQIIQARHKKAFAKPEDLLEVKGIGQKTLDKMRPRLKFDGAK